MAIDYSLFGGAESAFPPRTASETVTPPDSVSGSRSNSDSEDRPLARSARRRAGKPGQGASGPSNGAFSTGLLTPADELVLELQLKEIRAASAQQDEALKQAHGESQAQVDSIVPEHGEKAGKRAKLPADPADFLWLMTEEPHRSRRKAILKAHPEVRKLMGYTRATLPLVVFVVALQLSTAIALRNTPFLTWKFLVAAYVIGGTANQNIFLAIHEITHNLAFKRILPNKMLAMFANIVIGVPYAMAFKGYHIEHHKFLGEDGIDTDLPSKVEAIVLNNVIGKTFFATFQILFYALRPGFIRSQKPSIYHFINIAVVLFSDFLLVHFFGWKPVVYLLLSSFLAGSLHPCAAHFIAEHYLMSGIASKPTNTDSRLEGIRELSQETTSYYGWLNWLCYNVGYHNEHHDFPSVPWTRLPELHRIAKEFYDPLPSHPSWPAVTYQFITDPRVGMWSRGKRQSGEKGQRIDEEVWHQCLEKKQAEENSEPDSEMDALMSEAVERGYGSD